MEEEISEYQVWGKEPNLGIKKCKERRTNKDSENIMTQKKESFKTIKNSWLKAI